LVLDRGDGSGGNPVDRVSVGGGVFLEFSNGEVVGLVSGHSLLFSLSHGGHEVVSNGPGGTRGVMLLDEGVGLVEDVFAEVVLFDGGVRESLLRDVRHEFFLSIEGHLLLASHFVALEDTWGKTGSIGNSLASGRHGGTFAPGAEVVSITRSLVLVGTVALSRDGSSEKSGSDERAHFSLFGINNYNKNSS